ncbi:MAG: TIGR01212 family radical SAM protein [Lachnospiraceae bacterium]|nr:TIGR01212 family radical SAM protein [Lachnospiraceae bacterium]
MLTNETLWHGKPYYSLDAYCKNTYHEKLYKIALDAGMTCPNRDGTLDTRGCIFCSEGGSGDFAVRSHPVRPMKDQIAEGLSLFREKKTGSRFIAYFQAYTNTYAPLSYLRAIYTEALEEPCIAGISIATRPDCITEGVLSLLARLRHQYPDKFIWVELGLQTIHEETAAFIRRGYPLSVFDAALSKLNAIGIPVVVHLILGLPGETDQQILQSVSYLNDRPVFGVKLQLLHVLKNTDLAEYYAQGKFEALTKEHYIRLLLSSIGCLSPDIVIHRLTGDGPKEQVIAPLFSLNKRDVLNTFHQECRQKSIWQGKFLHDTGTIDFI